MMFLENRSNLLTDFWKRPKNANDNESLYINLYDIYN